MVQSQPRQIVLKTLCQKYASQKKRAGEVAQVLEHLSCKHETLSSNPTPAQKKKKKSREPNI
jgi:hypothetical protein